MPDYKLQVFCLKIPRKKWYAVKFEYNKELVDGIKALEKTHRKWNAVSNAWEIQVYDLFDIIKSYKGSTFIHFEFGDTKHRDEFIKLVKKVQEEQEEEKGQLRVLSENKMIWEKYKNELETTYINYIDLVHENLKPETKLYPYQIIATMFLHKTRNALLALDMGTGKSLVSLAYCELNNFNKVFVITPNSLKYNYCNEVEKFTNSKVYIIGKKNKNTIEDSKYFIVNYEFFSSSKYTNVKNKLIKYNIKDIDCLICDESHRLKSSKSHTYKNFKKYFKPEVFKDGNVSKIFMSGTPMPSAAKELFTVLHQISPLDFATQKYFYEYYCGMTYNLDGYGWETNSSEAKLSELFDKISPYVYRKKKSEVLKDLPEKIYQKVLLEMTSQEYDIYYDLERGIANEFHNNISPMNQVSIMGKLREYTSYLKVNAVGDLIDSILDCGEKFVIVDFYKKSLKRLNEKYPDISELHTGDVDDTIRANIVENFQDDEGKIKILLGSESTTKEGLTLTAANKVGILTIPYTPSILDQISDRLCRIGQKNVVNVYLFIYKDTIDEYIFDLIENKRTEISQVIDGENYVSNITESIIIKLIEKIKKKYDIQ